MHDIEIGTIVLNAKSSSYEMLNGQMVFKDVKIARSGLFEYPETLPIFKNAILEGKAKPKGSKVVVYRDNLSFTEELMSSFVNATITHEHPANGKVDGDNYKELAIGNLGDHIYFKNGEMYANRVYICDSEAMRLIANGIKKEVSIGGRANYDFMNKGVFDGVPYEATETLSSGNHLALTAKGLAGSEFALNSKLGETMSTIKQDGFEGDVAKSQITSKDLTDQSAVLNAALQDISILKNSFTALQQSFNTMQNTLLANALSSKKDEEGSEKDTVENSDKKKEDDKEDKKESDVKNSFVENSSFKIEESSKFKLNSFQSRDFLSNPDKFMSALMENK